MDLMLNPDSIILYSNFWAKFVLGQVVTTLGLSFFKCYERKITEFRKLGYYDEMMPTRT